MDWTRSVSYALIVKKSREFCISRLIPGKLYKATKNIPGIIRVNYRKTKCPGGQKVSMKMKNEKKEFVMSLQGKAVREFAQRLINCNYRIEKQSLNRYRVYDGPGDDYTLINRRSFVLLDKELYKLQARTNPLAAAIERALDSDALEFCISKASVDKMQVKLFARTFSSAKVELENVKLKADNYIICFKLVPSVSERDLTQKEMEIAEIFIQANTNAAAGTTETEMQALPPAPEVEIPKK